MARLSKLRKALMGTYLALLLGLLVATSDVSPALSIGLPLLPVEIPTVTVKTPIATVTTPSVQVRAPTAERPSVPVPAPTVSTKTPAPAKADPSRAPSVKVDAQTVSGEGPTVPAQAPSAPSLGKVAAPVGGVTTVATPTSTPAPATPAASRTASSPPAVTPNGTSSAEPSGQPSPAEAISGYGPGPESSTGEKGTSHTPTENSFIAKDGSLAETVSRLRGCLSELPERSRRALVLRAGVGSPQALGPRATAARLHLGVERFARVERRALAELRNAARTGACGQRSEVAKAVVAFLRASAGQGGFGASGGVEAARYTFSSPSRHEIKRAGSSGGSLLGDISPTASDAVVVLLLVLGAAIAAGFLVTHGSGHSPPWRRWRRRVTDSLRRPR
jgi:hypothetical protein